MNTPTSKPGNSFMGIMSGAADIYRERQATAPAAMDSNQLGAPASEILFKEISTSTVQRIQTLEEHRAVLKRVFDTAKERVLIVSPFISRSLSGFIASSPAYRLFHKLA